MRSRPTAESPPCGRARATVRTRPHFLARAERAAGGKVVTIPLAPRTARGLDLAIGERTGGSIFLDADGRRLDCHSAGRIVRRIGRPALNAHRARRRAAPQNSSTARPPLLQVRSSDSPRPGSVVRLPLLVEHLGDVRQLPTRPRIIVDTSDTLKPGLRIEAVLLRQEP